MPEAAKLADIIMILINDENQADMYKQDIAPIPDRWQGSGFRPRLQHPLPADRAPRRRGRVHGCPQGPRPHRPQPSMSPARACPAWSPWSRTPPARPMTSALALHRRHRRCPRRRHGDHLPRRDRDRPLRRAGCSVRRRGRADEAAASRPWSRPATSLRTLTSSASTR